MRATLWNVPKGIRSGSVQKSWIPGFCPCCENDWLKTRSRPNMPKAKRDAWRRRMKRTARREGLRQIEEGQDD